MQVTKIKQSVQGGIRELAADVLFETEGITEHMFIRMPDTGAENPCPADTFFVAFVLPAMALGERLTIAAPVSSDVYSTVVNHSLLLMRNWFPQLAKPQIECELGEPVARADGGKVCSLFSGGVDSLHTLLQRRSEVDVLVHMRGFEANLDNDLIWNAAHGAVHETAVEFGKEVVELSSNILYRTLLHTDYRKDFDWLNFREQAWGGHYWGAVGLALRPFASTLFVPSTYDHTVIRIATHPLVEPMFSVSSIKFELTGMPLSRLEKLSDLCEWYPKFIENLRVCTEEPYWSYSGAMNCGCCGKCIRTQVELRLTGVEKATEPFDWPFDLTILKYLRRPSAPTAIELWVQTESLARDQNGLELAEAIRAFRTRPYWRQKLRKFEYRLRKRLLPAGLKPSWSNPDWKTKPRPASL